MEKNQIFEYLSERRQQGAPLPLARTALLDALESEQLHDDLSLSQALSE